MTKMYNNTNKPSYCYEGYLSQKQEVRGSN